MACAQVILHLFRRHQGLHICPPLTRSMTEGHEQQPSPPASPFARLPSYIPNNCVTQTTK